MKPFEEDLYRLIQDIRSGTNPFTTQQEDNATDLQQIVSFAEKWDFKDAYQQAQNQVESLGKKLAETRQTVSQEVSLTFTKEIIPVLDSSYQALNYLRLSQESSPLIKTLETSLQFLIQQLSSIFTKRGGGLILPKVGDLFNPLYHSAITAEKSSQHRGNIVSEVLRQGYFLGQQVIRPAEVRVWIGAPQS